MTYDRAMAPASPYAETSPQFAEVGSGITLCYETLGDPADPTLLLIMGLGNQLIEWHRDLCEQFVSEGFHVIRFDNRDAGRSTFVDDPVDVQEVLLALGALQEPTVPYLLADMAADTVGLLDHLGIAQAHVVGISLGGMIGQQLALDAPERVASLSSLMARTGDPDVGLPSAAGLNALMERAAETLDAVIAGAIAHSKVWGSVGASEDDIRAAQTAKWNRKYDPSGTERQFAAILASGSRSDRLRTTTVPTLAIHGTKDELIQPDGSERLAEVVPDAKLVLIEDMGHDLARWTWPLLVDAITAHTREHPAG
jgi:pimeloyl-ACP methyl ester carboxylesterase